MIFPPNTKLRLDPRDEYTHTPEPVPNYNESMYFNAFDMKSGIGSWMRIGMEPIGAKPCRFFLASIPNMTPSIAAPSMKLTSPERAG